MKKNALFTLLLTFFIISAAFCGNSPAAEKFGIAFMGNAAAD